MKKTDDLYEQHSSHLLSFGRLSLSLFQNHTRNIPRPNIPLSLSYTRSVRSVHYVHHPVSKSNFLLVNNGIWSTLFIGKLDNTILPVDCNSLDV